MASNTAPNTKDWKAYEDHRPPPPTKLPLHAVGQVELTALNQKPHLAKVTPQGLSPKILLLDLTIKSSGGGGGQQMNW